MKKSIIFLSCAILAIFASCEEDKNVDKGYPKMSTIDEVKITSLGSGTAGEVVAGYDARIEAKFTAGDYSLISLKFVITSGTTMIASEIAYIEDGQTSATKEFTIPFVPNLNDNTYLDIMLLLEDSEGNETEKKLTNEDNVKVRRPSFGNKLYLVDSNSEAVIDMDKVDDSDYQYKTSATLNNEISFRVAEKLTQDNKIDYSGFVWALPEGYQLELTDKDTSTPVTISEPGSAAITWVGFDVLSFQYSRALTAKATPHVNDIELVKDAVYSDYRSASVLLTQNEEVEFRNFEDIETLINPEFFEYVSPTKAKFLGLTSTYELHLHETNGYLFIEQKDAAEGDAMWMLNTSLGFPNYGYNSSYKLGPGSWNWLEPARYVFFRKVSDNVFSGSFYTEWMSAFLVTSAKSTAGAPPSLKLPLESGYTITSTPAGLFKIETGAPDQAGRIVANGSFTKGNYQITVNTSAKTVHVKWLSAPVIKQTELEKDKTYSGFMSATISLTQGEEVEFENFLSLEKQLDPGFFEYVSPTKAKFIGLTNDYDLHFKLADGYLFMEKNNALEGDALWMFSSNSGFPNYGYNAAYKVPSAGSWSWDTPNRYFVIPKVSDNVFSGMFYTTWLSAFFATSRESTPYLPSSYRVMLEDGYTLTSTPAEKFKIGTGGDVGRIIPNGASAGIYRVTINTSGKTIHLELQQ